jgi:Flp pilus assembly protein TadD
MLFKARALSLAGRTEDARLVCTEAQRIDANNSKILETLADVYAAAGLNDRAERVRQQAREVQTRQSRRPRGG